MAKKNAGCTRCDSAEDRRYTEAVEALLNSGSVDQATVRAFFEYVDGELTDDEMEFLVGGNGRMSLRPATAARYGYSSG